MLTVIRILTVQLVLARKKKKTEDKLVNYIEEMM